MKCVNHPDRDASTNCISCGNPICEECKVISKGEEYCKKCIARKAESAPFKKRSPGLAALLSFLLAGLGQIYNGQLGKGLLILFTGWLILPWIYGIFDAYRTAKRINAGQIETKDRSGCMAALIILLVLTTITAALLGFVAAISLPNLTKVMEAAMTGTCSANLEQIEAAKRSWATETGAAATATPTWNNLVPKYLKKKLTCPHGGVYTIGSVGSPATCSVCVKQSKKPVIRVRKKPAKTSAVPEPPQHEKTTIPEAAPSVKTGASAVITEAVEIREKLKAALPGLKAKGKSVKIYLKNGRSFEAVIMEDRPDTLVLKINGGTVTIGKNEIDRLKENERELQQKTEIPKKSE